MTRPILAAALAAALIITASPATAQQATTPLAVGAAAPAFELTGATRYGVVAKPVRLGDFAGKTVVLAYFPAARTRGCTIQMMEYRDRFAELFNNGQDVVLIAISADPAETLAEWAAEAQFPFLMASDPGATIARQYGADRGERTNRNLFVIGPDGRVAYTATPFREIDPTAYTELGGAIRALLPADIQ
jgi:thioredoxin-dependent peroxiredoxin